MKFKYIVTIILAVVLLGCGVKYISTGHTGGAKAYIDAAMSHTDKDGKPLLKKATEEVDKTETQIAEEAKQRSVLEKQNTNLSNDLRDERSQWCSDFQHRIFGWLTLLAGVGVVLCCVGLIGASPIYTLCAHVGRICIYASVIYAVFAWAFDHIWLKKVTSGGE